MSTFFKSATIRHRSKILLRFAWLATVIATLLTFSVPMHAQYGGGGTMGTGGTGGTTSTGSSTPSYGHGKAIGIGVGAGAVAAGALYFATHRSTSVIGCVRAADDGLHLTDDKTNKSFTVSPGNTDVKPGERLQLKGKISKDKSGAETFRAKKLVKDMGTCNAQADASLGRP